MNKYIIITPVRNEAAYITKTIESVVNQTIRPLEWIIVNDGSTDTTGDIIESYVRTNIWIKVINRIDRGFRQAGGGVIEAFYDGYNQITSNDWEFLIKLDGDLSFERDYFEKCFIEFEKNENLGICGGIILNEINGEYKIESAPLYHVRGATKIYKKECWYAIEPLIRAPGWDTLDEIKANMLGWKTRSQSHLKLFHHRFTGKADGAWNTSVKYGNVNYYVGYHPLFMILKCLKRIVEKPYLIGSIGICYGYLEGYLKKLPRAEEKVIKYVRKEQLNLIFFRKSIWDDDQNIG